MRRASEERRGILKLLATILLVACALVLVGKRADRVYEARAVSEAEPIASRLPVSLTAPRPAGLYRGESAQVWATRYRMRTRQFQNARRVLMARPSLDEAIALASVVYNVPRGTLRRKAWCESKFDPNAVNTSESTTDAPSGTWQFKPSTWATTPFARFSIWSIYAQALAAGWMHSAGRGGEWSCR